MLTQLEEKGKVRGIALIIMLLNITGSSQYRVQMVRVVTHVSTKPNCLKNHLSAPNFMSGHPYWEFIPCTHVQQG